MYIFSVNSCMDDFILGLLDQVDPKIIILHGLLLIWVEDLVSVNFSTHRSLNLCMMHTTLLPWKHEPENQRTADHPTTF